MSPKKTAFLLTISLLMGVNGLANASLTYSSNFNNDNLSVDFAPQGVTPTANMFSVVPGSMNDLPAGDQIDFSLDASQASDFLRGTSSPMSIPNLVTVEETGLFSADFDVTIQFMVTGDVERIELIVSDVEGGGSPVTTLSFSGLIPTSVTGALSLTGSDVVGTSQTNGSLGTIIWDLTGAPVANPMIAYTSSKTSTFGGDQTHYVDIMYTVPEPSSILVLLTGLGFLILPRPRR